MTFKKPSPNTLLGIKVIGGNATGIFISEVEKESPASLQGSFRIGDRILQVSMIGRFPYLPLSIVRVRSCGGG